MVDSLCDYLTNKIRKENPEIDDERAEIIDYGVHLIIGEIPKFFIIIGIAFLLGIWKLTLLTVVLLIPYRSSSGGFHLKTHLGCIVGTVAFYCGIVLCSQYFTLEGIGKYIFTIFVWIFGMIMVKLYAPADTENVPIISEKDRKNKRILSYITLTLTIVASTFIQDITISHILLYSTLFQSISISRFAYNITNNKYGHEVYQAS